MEISDNDLLIKFSKKIVKKVDVEPNKLTDYSSGDLIYPFTNENLFEYYNKILENKKVLSVISSGDHILHAVLAGAKEIVGFDINRFCKYYCALKIAMIKTYDIHEFESLIHEFVCGSNKIEVTIKILKDVQKYLLKQEISFWNIYLKILNDKKYFDLFTSDGALLYNNDYLDIDYDTYKPLQEKLFDSNIRYIDCGINKITQLNEKFDVIYLSNILALINNSEFNCNFLNELSKILNKNGIIYDYCFEKMDWHYNYENVYNPESIKYIDDILSSYEIEVNEYESCIYSDAKVYKYIKR